MTLNVRIKVKIYTVSEDAYGQPVQTLSETTTRWAEANKKGGTMYNMGAVEWKYDLEFKTRFYKSAPITTENIIEFEGTNYKVLSVSEDNEGYKFFQKVKCQAIE